VLAIHIATSWGYIGLYWGDTGRWLYEVDRFAHGASLYRDVYWPFPPLAMWIVGGSARVIGSDLSQVWMITASIAVLIGVAYALIIAALLPTRIAVLAAATGMTLGAAYSSDFSAPLVSGMYTPAVPVAVLCLFAQLALFVQGWSRPAIANAAIVGALGGAGIMAKHDVWPACVVLVIASAFVAPSGAGQRSARAAAAVGAFIAIAGGGIALLATQHGIASLGAIFSGYGQLQELQGMNYPNLTQAVVELAALGIAAAIVGAVAWASGSWRSRGTLMFVAVGATLALVAAAIWLLRAELVARHVLAQGSSEFAPPFERSLLPFSPNALRRLRNEVLVLRLELIRRLIPVAVPFALLALAFARRRLAEPLRWRLLVVLLSVVVALRARRMLSYDEWSALMLEVPVYAYAVMTLWPLSRTQLQRAVASMCAFLFVGGLVAQRLFGFGIMTRRGTYPWTETARGGVRLSPNHVATYRRVRDYTLLADPSGSRPLLAYGYSSGHNYLLGRPGVGSLTHGFRISLYPTPDSAYRVAQAQHDRLILVDNAAYKDAVPAAEFAPWRWQPRMKVNHYVRVDRTLFERLQVGCREMTPSQDGRLMSVYDCAPSSRIGVNP
jgi:hypothetical protein